MKKATALKELASNKPEDLAEKATRDSRLLLEFAGISSSNSKLRINSAKILSLIGRKNPQKLY